LPSDGVLGGIAAQLAADEWSPIDLGRAALHVAGLFCADLDVAREHAALDALAARVRPLVERESPGLARLRALVQALHEGEGFGGSAEAFEDPRSSFLHEVLRRRSGLPITLALVYTEVGRRTGVPLFGIAFPGHFLVGFGPGPDAIVDAFAGHLLGAAECEERLRGLLGAEQAPRRAQRAEGERSQTAPRRAQRAEGERSQTAPRRAQRAEGERRPARIAPALLGPASPRQILVRMLTNLKVLYAQRGEEPEALVACQAICELVPGDAANLRDRGLLFDRLGHAQAALRDLERFAELAPEDATIPSVQARIAVLRQQRTLLH
jgi:regulator of sirC expression with transglutaminase-like and TPR domain